MNIDQYIAQEMLKPFEPGQTDCANTADRWFAIRRGFSAMARFGRHVRNADDMTGWLSEPRGLLRGIKDVMAANNVAETRDPQPGDVGIVVVGIRVCIALYNGETWWSRDHDGFVAADDSHRYIAWSVG